VVGGLGNDILHGGANDDAVAGDNGGGTGGNDAVFGDAGDDLVAGGQGNDTVDGGADADDTVVGGPGADTVTGGDGNDGFVAGGPGNDTVSGGVGNDSVYGDCGGGCGTAAPGDDVVNGDAGDDYVIGEAGRDTVSGGDGDDYTAGDCDFSNCSSGTAGNDAVSGDAGDDEAYGEAGDDIVHGGDGDDTVYGDNNNSQGGADQVFGDAGDDDVRAQKGNDTADGGDGSDYVAVGQGDDTASGGAGDDTVYGGSGSDTVDGGAGADDVYGDCGGYHECGDGTDGNDTVLGGDGDDFSEADGGTDTIDLGNGIDQVEYQNNVDGSPYPVSVTLDGAANDGGSGENDNVATEDVAIDCCDDQAGATLVGDAGTNVLDGSAAGDTIDGGGGNDFLYANDGDDTINANDGFADRVDCGRGNDVANVDEFDQVSGDCETVNRTTRGQLASEDHPPAVAWTAPASGAKMSTAAANTLTVTASDDKGVSQVIFMAGERVICTVTAAPYTCAYKPTDADVGRTTLVAIAVDSSQQTASAVRVVSVPRFKPSKVTISTSPKKDSTAPFKFTTKGKISLPSGVSAAAGCSGTVAVTFKAGKKTISTRKAKVSKSCTYRSKVTFSLPARLHPKTLRAQATFRGNAVLTARASSRKKVKVS
jgi:Ca2+-binding RTX toxin-like protein